MKKIILLTATIICGAGIAFGQMAAPSDTSIKVTVTKLADHIYRTTCAGEFETNQIASVGPDGILLVDAGMAGTAPALADTLRELHDGRIRLVINTHSHGDHAWGNHVFKDEAIIIAQRYAGDNLSGGYFALPALRNDNSPTVLFDDSLTINFNGEEVRVYHVPNAHTGGDVVVHFVNSGIVCIGDLIFPDHIPFVDLPLQGSTVSYIRNVQLLIDAYSPGVQYVAGHGRVYSRDDLVKYHAELVKMSDLVRQAIAAGKTVDQMKADKLLGTWESWDGPWITTKIDYWTDILYQELSSPTGKAKPQIAAPMTETIVARGTAAAVEQYHQLKRDRPDDFDFGENGLNALGYQLLARNMIDDAVAIFLLNTGAYPNSFNVYDSYGEALLAKGDTALAITNYRKSLELNPDNTNAVQVLTRLGAK
ncbi:MAG: MBL fold metallo-hydrolase [candidate division Zixibacteria bacterium]|nr:MBL fold metallo-hydrolase [candidate division Zixibacteria bacterium]